MFLTCQEKIVQGDTFLERARTVAEAGYAGIDLMGQGLKGRVAEVKEAVLETGLQTPAVYSQLGPNARLLDQNSAVRVQALDVLKERLEAAAEVGADYVVFVPKRSETVRDEAQVWLLVTILDELTAWLNDMPVTLVLEPLNREETDFLTDPEEAARIVRLVHHPRLKTMVDTYHMELESQNIPETIRNIRDVLGLVHLSDTGRSLPGRGQVDFSAVLTALQAVGYSGPMGLEGGGPYGRDDLKTCADYLKSLANRGDEMSKRWKVAVMGAGAMGGTHVEGWQSAGHEVVSVTDVDEAQARKVAEQFGVPRVYTDFHESAIDPEVDIVSIALPVPLHAPVTVFAAEQGKHVFCEKPLARSFAEAAAMEEAVRRAGVGFGIGFQRSFVNSLEAVKRFADEDVFGHPRVVTSYALAEVRPKRIMHDANGNMGPVVENCCHYFMMWKRIFGADPVTVYALGGVFAKDRPEIAHFEKKAVDTALISVQYASGDLAEMTISWGMAKGFKLRGLPDRIFGPKGGAEGNFTSLTDKITLYRGDGVEEVPIDKAQNLHVEQFGSFVAALERGTPPPIGFQDGKETLALSLAALESIETGEVVRYRVPEPEAVSR